MSKSVVAKKKDDLQFDLEQQFILRMPPGSAIALQRDIQSGAMNLKDKLNIELEQDCRIGKVVYGGLVMPAQLVDLPTIVESLKTTDKKTFYKTADICQMLICGMDDGDKVWTKNTESKYRWNHGLTAPMKSVRTRRFRKTLHKNNPEQPDIEKEVKRLFRMDNEAIDVKWEVIAEQEKDNEQEKQVLAHGEYNKNTQVQPKVEFTEFDELDMFGEMSSSDDDDDNDDTVGANDADNNDFQTRLLELADDIESLKERKLANRLDQQIPHSHEALVQLQQAFRVLSEEQEKKEQEHKLLSSMLNS